MFKGIYDDRFNLNLQLHQNQRQHQNNCASLLLVASMPDAEFLIVPKFVNASKITLEIRL